MTNFRSTLPVIPFAILLMWTLSNPSNTLSMRWWCAAIIISNLNLQFFSFRQLAADIQPKQARQVASTLILLHLIEGLLWGLLPWLALDLASQAGFVLVLAVFTGMLGAALATLSPVPLMFIVFAVPQTVSLVIKLASFGDSSYNIFIASIVLYLTSLLGQALSSARVSRAAIDVRFELADSHHQLRQIERRQTLEQERQRLMQDMHDGLGSTLVSALRVVEHGKMEASEVAQVLKGCIDDLKLAIDSMEPVDDNLLLLLATLRFRLGPRLESTGITLLWQVENVPELDWLDTKNALHILRILQEAFTNIIKHTNATEVRVATHLQGDYVIVTIADNGQGFAVDDGYKAGGKGLSSQKRRAMAIGGEIKLESNTAGTLVTLNLPIKQVITTDSL
jgi:signal transduction histidine kinase